MNEQPTLSTERLLLRPLQTGDAPAIQKLAGEKAIAENTFIPHPYKQGMAEEFIASRKRKWDNGTDATFAINLQENDKLIGIIGLKDVSLQNKRAEMGFWIGIPYWGNGYATEAAQSLLNFAFSRLDLNRVFAAHFHTNPASGKILNKIGMKKEGVQRQHLLRFGKYRDVVLFGALKSEWSRT